MTVLARIRLRLLGQPRLTFGDNPAPVRLSTRKVSALVAYLAMSPDQAASREELATLLWGSSSDQQARQSLRQALAFLRKDLGVKDLAAKDLAAKDYFTADANVRLGRALWTADALELETLSTSSNPQDLDRAASLFRGDFLAGFNIEEDGFAEWLRAQRARTQLAATRLCEALAARPEVVIDGERAVAAAEQLLALDPLREDWQRLALTLYARHRSKSEALAQAKAFAGLLQRELGVGLEKETRALIEKIQGGEIRPAVSPISPALLTTGAASHASGDATPPIAPPSLRDQEADHIAAPVAAQPLPAPRQWRGWATAAALSIAVVMMAGELFGLGRGRAVPDLSAPSNGQTQMPSFRGTVPVTVSGDTSASSRSIADASLESGLVAMVVMPFTIAGEGSEHGLLADVMTDDLTNMLSRVGGLRVISRQTAQSYRGERVDPAAIGAELGVRYLLEGSVSVRGDRLNVNIELIDTKSRQRVWTGRYDRSGADRNAITDEIVNGLGRELQVEVFLTEGERAPPLPDKRVDTGRPNGTMTAETHKSPLLTSAD